MPHAIPRRRSPVVIVGYGDAGLEWLSGLCLRCSDTPELRPLLVTETLQFWCFGVAANTLSGIQTFQDWPDAATLSDALDRARGTGNVASVPGLAVQEVLLLERISLFAPSAPAARKTLQSVVSNIPGVQWGTSDDTVGFRIRWIALADSLHDVARTRVDEKQTALKAATENARVSTTYLVDREDSATAVLNVSVANAALMELAVTYLNGDLGAPRADGHSVVLPQVLTSHNAAVIPFSVTILQHRWREIEQRRVEDLLQQLTGGIPDHQVRATLSARPPIDQSLEADSRYLSEHRYDPYRRNRIRDEAVEETMVLALAEADVRRLRDHLVSFRRKVVQLVSKQRLAPVLGGMAGVGIATVQDSPENFFGLANRSLFATTLLVVLVSVAALWRFYHRRQTTAVAELSSEVIQSDASWLEVRDTWEAACTRLEQFYDYWETELDAVAATRRMSGNQHAMWQPLPPFGRSLNVQQLETALQFSVTHSTCKQIAKHVHEGMLKRISPKDAIRLACENEIRRTTPANAESSIISHQLKRALGAAYTTELSQLLGACPYLLKSRLPIAREAVLWFSHHSLGIDRELLDLESTTHRESTSIFTHDDVDRSVRIAIGAPLDWDSVVSLHSGFTTSVDHEATK